MLTIFVYKYTDKNTHKSMFKLHYFENGAYTHSSEKLDEKTFLSLKFILLKNASILFLTVVKSVKHLDMQTISINTVS